MCFHNYLLTTYVSTYHLSSINVEILEFGILFICHLLPVNRAVDEYDPAAQAEAGTRRPEEYVLSVFISILKFFGIFIGSFLLGVVMAMITALVMKMSKLREHPLLETSMFIILSYSTFVIAEAAGLTGTCLCRCVCMCLYVCVCMCTCTQACLCIENV